MFAVDAVKECCGHVVWVARRSKDNVAAFLAFHCDRPASCLSVVCGSVVESEVDGVFNNVVREFGVHVLDICAVCEEASVWSASVPEFVHVLFERAGHVSNIPKCE